MIEVFIRGHPSGMSAQIWGFLGPPPLVQTCPHLVDHPRLSLSVQKQGWHYFKHCNLWTIPSEELKKLIILILDAHTRVFLLDNFDNIIPKDGVDHEVNVTHRHDWWNKNASVPKSLPGKRKNSIFQPLWHENFVAVILVWKQRKKHLNEDNIRNDVITLRSIHSLLNTSRMKILYRDILPNYLSKFHKYGSYNFFSKRTSTFGSPPSPPVCIYPLLPDPSPP